MVTWNGIKIDVLIPVFYVYSRKFYQNWGTCQIFHNTIAVLKVLP